MMGGWVKFRSAWDISGAVQQTSVAALQRSPKSLKWMGTCFKTGKKTQYKLNKIAPYGLLGVLQVSGGQGSQIDLNRRDVHPQAISASVHQVKVGYESYYRVFRG